MKMPTGKVRESKALPPVLLLLDEKEGFWRLSLSFSLKSAFIQGGGRQEKYHSFLALAHFLSVRDYAEAFLKSLKQALKISAQKKNYLGTAVT